MKKRFHIIVAIISYFFILLFVYASISKLTDFETFQIQLAQSPLFGDVAVIVSYAVIALELVIVFLLFFQQSRLLGLYASLAIMSAFTFYIYLIINFSDSIPCSCGGLLEKMNWDEHLLFNSLCVMLALIAIVTTGTENKKKLVVFLSLTIILPIVFISILFYPHINDNQGNFTRKIVNPLETENKILEFPMNNYYFAGNHGDTLFLANRKTPLLFLTISPDFNTVKVDTIKLDHYHHQFVSVSINVVYPYFSVSDGKVPVVFEGKLPSLKAYDTGINRLFFSSFYMLASQHYLFRTTLVKTKENELGILNTTTQEYQVFPNVLQTKVDGVFDTDGSITIDRQNRQIIYTHFYRNEIITTDFGMRNIQRTRTLDSLSHTMIETKTLKNGQTKLVRSPSIINAAQTVYNNKFYNVSNMRGNNESFYDFRNNDAVDVYDASAKKYLHSFYIKNEKRIQIKSILSTKHYLYVLSGNTITRYTFK